jgi:hypothetical protein
MRERHLIPLRYSGPVYALSTQGRRGVLVLSCGLYLLVWSNPDRNLLDGLRELRPMQPRV